MTINSVVLYRVNGKKAYAPKMIKPFKLKNKDYKKVKIKFDGKVQSGRNECLIILPVYDYKGGPQDGEEVSVCC